MHSSDSGGGGAADAGAGEPVWNWGNLLDFVVQDDDSLVPPWDGAAGIGADAAGVGADAAEAALLATPPPQQVEVDPDGEPDSEPVLPPPPLRVQGIGRRARKRDPRLGCPNYLAGRVPCACPEADEMAAAAEVDDVATDSRAGARKKTKTAALRGSGGARRVVAAEMKCQVPGCDVDIRQLKGYHRRHRVCVRCAHASAVMLDGIQQRYCQQCGKFHVLPDFDEDKRSCRRKLEWHNKRRRRKSDSKGTLEKEIDEQLELSADVSGNGDFREENMECATNEMIETVLSNKVLDSETPLGSEDVLRSPTCTQPSLENDQSKSVVTFAASGEACMGAKQGIAELTNSPVHDTKSAYSSLCPTGRISFKLYDWNPAEFPRRLRHQIFEWLASMPVELEGYIRPGCTILTVFIAMPQHMWGKLSDNTENLLRNLVNSPNSLLLGKGTFFIHVDNMIFQVLKDGARLMSTRLEVQAPRIHYVHPTWFEARKPVELLLCGSSLDQPKFRSLLSYDGDYLTHDCCRLTSHDTFSRVESGGLILDSQHELFRINITQSGVDTHGLAFVEVENMYGLSNFVPILFGSKQLCSELERICDALCPSSYENNSVFGEFPGSSSDTCQRRKLQSTAMSGFLSDIGWLIRKRTPDEFENVLSLTNIQRWICMLKFLIQNDFVNVLEIIVKSMDNIIGSVILSNMEKERLEDHVTAFLGYVSHARSNVGHRAKQGEITQRETRWGRDYSSNQPSLGSAVPRAKQYPDPGGYHDLHSTSSNCATYYKRCLTQTEAMLRP